MINYWLVEAVKFTPRRDISTTENYETTMRWKTKKIICVAAIFAVGRVNYVFRQQWRRLRLLQIALNSLLNYFRLFFLHSRLRVVGLQTRIVCRYYYARKLKKFSLCLLFCFQNTDNCYLNTKKRINCILKWNYQGKFLFCCLLFRVVFFHFFLLSNVVSFEWALKSFFYLQLSSSLTELPTIFFCWLCTFF